MWMVCVSLSVCFNRYYHWLLKYGWMITTFSSYFPLQAHAFSCPVKFDVSVIQCRSHIHWTSSKSNFSLAASDFPLTTLDSILSLMLCCSVVVVELYQWITLLIYLLGMKVGLTFISMIACQSTSFNHTCYLTSLGPLSPNLLAGFLCKHLLMKSAASMLHPSGMSDFFS